MTMLREYNDIMSVEDACEILGIGRNNIYKLLGSGKLKAFKNGRVWRIPKYEVARFIESQTSITNINIQNEYITEEEFDMNDTIDLINVDLDNYEEKIYSPSTVPHVYSNMCSRDSMWPMYNALISGDHQNVMQEQLESIDSARPKPKMRQLLTEEEISILENKEDYLCINEVEFIMAKCTHRKNGRSILSVKNNSVYCPICKQTFDMCDTYAKDDIELLINSLISVLQSIKAMDLDISDATGEYMKIIPVLKRVPEMYVNALNTLSQYDNIGSLKL